jgi:hypothetical protein
MSPITGFKALDGQLFNWLRHIYLSSSSFSRTKYYHNKVNNSIDLPTGYR